MTPAQEAYVRWVVLLSQSFSIATGVMFAAVILQGVL